MKIRIKGPSVRLRLSRSEVAKLVNEGYLEEFTPFPVAAFIYALQKTTYGDSLSAAFDDGKITMYVPAPLIMDWDKNDLVTIENNMPLNDTEGLHLLLEKDFVCLDQTGEDQSDNYTNPNQTC